MSNAFSTTLGARDVSCAVFVFIVTCVKTSFLVENVTAALDRHTREKKTCDTRALGAHTIPEIIALITCAQTPFSFWSGESPFTILR